MANSASVDRAHREFSDEQIANIAIISQLHKGRRERFLALVDHYFAQGVASLHAHQSGIEALCAQLFEALDDKAARKTVTDLKKQWAGLAILEERYAGYLLRFPGHKQSKIERVLPKGWSLVKTESAFKFYGGATPARDTPRYWQHGEVNWFTPTDITGADGIFLASSGEQCTDEGLRNCSSTLFPSYSVMMTSRATIGAIGINLMPACTNQGFITCVPNIP